MDLREDLHQALAAWAFQHVDRKHSAHQLSPRVVTLVDAVRCRKACLHRACGLGSRSVCRSVLLRARRCSFLCIIRPRHDAFASRSAGSQHTVTADQMNAWCRNQRRQLGNEFKWLENDVRRAITPTLLQLIQEPSIVERGSRARNAIPVPRRSARLSIQILGDPARIWSLVVPREPTDSPTNPPPRASPPLR